jgi:hypothetical protein
MKLRPPGGIVEAIQAMLLQPNVISEEDYLNGPIEPIEPIESIALSGEVQLNDSNELTELIEPNAKSKEARTHSGPER